MSDLMIREWITLPPGFYRSNEYQRQVMHLKLNDLARKSIQLKPLIPSLSFTPGQSKGNITATSDLLNVNSIAFFNSIFSPDSATRNLSRMSF